MGKGRKKRRRKKRKKVQATKTYFVDNPFELLESRRKVIESRVYIFSWIVYCICTISVIGMVVFTSLAAVYKETWMFIGMSIFITLAGCSWCIGCVIKIRENMITWPL